MNKINHLQRTIFPEIIDDFVKKFEVLKRKLLCEILHIPELPEDAWSQATLQFEYGGLGLRNAADTTDCAFVASALSCLPSIVKFFPCIQSMLDNRDYSLGWLKVLQSACCRLAQTDEDYYEDKIAFRGGVFDPGKLFELNLGNADKLQAVLMIPRNKCKGQAFLATPADMNDREIARRVAVASSEAAALFRIACLSPGRHLGSHHFIVATKQFLGIPVNAHFDIGQCICKAKRNLINEFGDHFFTCPVGGERYVTHDGLKLVVAAMCNYAGIRTKIEPSHCLQNVDRSDKSKDLRPDILAYHAHVRVLNPANQHGLRNLILDISVAHPIAAFNINFKKKRNAAMTREREKIGKYSRQASDNNLDFLPLAFETFGSWGPIMRRFFEDIIAEAARHRHELKGPIAEYWMQRISAALHFGCANLLISRMQRVSEAAMVNRDESTNPDLRLVNPQL